MKSIQFIFVFILVFQLSFLLMGQSPPNEVLRFSTKCSIEEGKLVVDRSVQIRINEKRGDWLAEVVIPYRKNNKVEQLEAYITTSDNELIRKLRKKDVVDVSSISNVSLYEDDFQKEFELKHNVYPYIFYYTYKIRYSEFLQIADWYPVLHFDTPTRFAELNLEIPLDYSVNIREINIGPALVDTVDDRIKYQWRSDYGNKIDRESYSPLRKELLPDVKIVPLSFKYGEDGSFQDWETYGNWLYRLSNGLDKLPDYEAVKVKEIINGIEDTKERVRKLYHYMQDNTRYINVSIDIGGMKPYPAEYVARNKYGDCKALTNYMKSLLEMAQIPAYCVDISAGENRVSLIKDFPSQQFNHVLLFVPLGKDTIWLETTSNINPFGYLGTFTQNRYGLTVKENGSTLVKTPALTSNDVKEVRSIIVEIADEIMVQSKYTFKGRKFERFNYIYESYPKTYQEEEIHTIIPFENYALKSWEILKGNRDRAEIEIRSSVLTDDLIKSYGKKRIVSLVQLSTPRLETPGKRTQPLLFHLPINMEDTIIYQLTNNTFENIPSDTTINNTYGSYSVTYTSLSNKIVVVRKFELNAGEFNMDEYKSIFEFINAVRIYEQKSYLSFEDT